MKRTSKDRVIITLSLVIVLLLVLIIFLFIYFNTGITSSDGSIIVQLG
ncbi:hypothetical protein HYU09_02555 [Candidatus Woesearchaeota archaeon]|nr:hypothetical protein [Candidatus Woesearchaeota archaeon]